MSSLAGNHNAVQLRCVCSNSHPHLQYELMVQGLWTPVNRRYVDWAVGTLSFYWSTGPRRRWMLNETPNNINRVYLDKRGIRVRVIRYDREKQWVIFLRDDYEHECFAPLYKFKAEFTRVME